MDKLRKALVGLSLLGLMVTAAGSIVSASSVPASSLGAEPMGPSEVSGRTLCDGSIDRVFTDLSGAPADSIERLQAKYEDVPGFRSVVYDGQAAVVVVEARALEEWADLIDKAVRVAPSCVSEDLIEAAAAVVRDLDLGEDESAVSGYDALVDAAFVLSARPDSEIEAALDRSFASSGGSDQILKSRASGLLRLRQIQLGPVRSTRNADTSPHWGGARTRTSLGGGLIGLCTTGFYINSATNGTAMVTAGHCANDGQNGLTVRNGDASVVMGTTEGGRFPDPDLGLIDGGAYSGRTYSSTNQTSNKAIAKSHREWRWTCHRNRVLPVRSHEPSAVLQLLKSLCAALRRRMHERPRVCPGAVRTRWQHGLGRRFGRRRVPGIDVDNGGSSWHRDRANLRRERLLRMGSPVPDGPLDL